MTLQYITENGLNLQYVMVLAILLQSPVSLSMISLSGQIVCACGWSKNPSYCIQEGQRDRERKTEWELQSWREIQFTVRETEMKRKQQREAETDSVISRRASSSSRGLQGLLSVACLLISLSHGLAWPRKLISGTCNTPHPLCWPVQRPTLTAACSPNTNTQAPSWPWPCPVAPTRCIRAHTLACSITENL